MRKVFPIVLLMLLLPSCGEREGVMASKALDASARKLMESLTATLSVGRIDTQRPISVLFVEGMDGRFGEEARDKLEKYLIKTGRFNVVTPPSKRELENIMDVAEGMLKYETFFDPQFAIRLGKLISPKQAIVGKIKWIKRTSTGVTLSLDGMLIDLERGYRRWRDDAEVSYKDPRPVLLRVAGFAFVSILVFIGFRGLNDFTGGRFPVIIYTFFLVILVMIFYFMLYDYLFDYFKGR
jgi:curli biogenesis system outer membrane secretion channel CsgG